jgi:hypothetical protein
VLFPNHLPPLLEGETLFSWCARFHALSASSSARLTSRRIFGHPTAALRPDFPAALDRLVERIGLGAQEVDGILADHTVFPAFSPFLTDARHAAIVAAMRAAEPARIKSALGLPASRLGSPAPLKGCLDCMREDRARHGTGIWHADLQFPGVLICSRHGLPAFSLSASEQRCASLELMLPHQALERMPAESWRPSDTALETLAGLANWSRALAPLRFDPATLRRAYLSQLLSLGLILIDGRIGLKHVAGEISTSYGFVGEPGLSKLAGSAEAAYPMLRQLLTAPPHGLHPLKHLLLIAMIFRDIEELLRRYEEAQAVTDESLASALRAEQSLRTAVVCRLAAAGHSASSSAGITGISVTQVLKYLRGAEMPVAERPRVVGTPVEGALIELLEAGVAPADIASRLGIRRGFIKDYLAARPALREIHRQRLFENLRSRYRAHFLDVLEQHPGVPMRRIRRLPGNGFQWLLMHDRDWLAENLPGIWRR